MFGKKQSYKSKWLWGYFFVLMVSVVDWVITVNFGCSEVLHYVQLSQHPSGAINYHLFFSFKKYRVRRILRPYFLLQTSSLMKKTVRCVVKLGELISFQCF